MRELTWEHVVPSDEVLARAAAPSAPAGVGRPAARGQRAGGVLPRSPGGRGDDRGDHADDAHLLRLVQPRAPHGRRAAAHLPVRRSRGGPARRRCAPASRSSHSFRQAAGREAAGAQRCCRCRRRRAAGAVAGRRMTSPAVAALQRSHAATRSTAPAAPRVALSRYAADSLPRLHHPLSHRTHGQQDHGRRRRQRRRDDRAARRREGARRHGRHGRRRRGHPAGQGPRPVAVGADRGLRLARHRHERLRRDGRTPTSSSSRPASRASRACRATTC